MTVQTRFHNFQQLGAPKAVSDFAVQGFASPNLARIYKFLKETYGGQNLGYYPNPRNIRDGSSKSTHTWGALDWRYQDPGPGRDILLANIIPLLINNSLELGVQAIHDYYGDRIWRPPGTSGRDINGDGWKKQYGTGSQMGRSWALWIHVEVHPDAWFDDRDFITAIQGVTTPRPPPIIPPPLIIPPTGGKEIMLDISSRELVKGDRGPDVAFYQGILNRVAGNNLDTDGIYGDRTKTAIANWQKFFGLYVDGECGKHTQKSLIETSLATGK